MELLIYLLIFLVLFLLISPSKNSVKSTPCEGGHQWVLRNEGDEEEYMVCSICEYLPGLEIKEES